MAITIKPALRKNPQDKAAAAKYYAQVVLAPEMKQKQIVDQIATSQTVHPSAWKISVHSVLPFPVKVQKMPASVEQAVWKKHVSSMFLLPKSRKPFQCILSPRQEQAQRTKMAKEEMRNQIRNLTKAAEKLQTRQLKQWPVTKKTPASALSSFRTSQTNQGKSPMNEKSFHRAFHLRIFGERNMLLKVL